MPCPVGALVEQPVNDVDLVLQRFQRLAASCSASSPSPEPSGAPVILVHAVAHEQHREPFRERPPRRGGRKAGSDSSHGSAMVTPAPRRTVRREIRVLSGFLRSVRHLNHLSFGCALSRRGSEPRRFRNCGLVTIDLHQRTEPITVGCQVRRHLLDQPAHRTASAIGPAHRPATCGSGYRQNRFADARGCIRGRLRIRSPVRRPEISARVSTGRPARSLVRFSPTGP